MMRDRRKSVAKRQGCKARALVMAGGLSLLTIPGMVHAQSDAPPRDEFFWLGQMNNEPLRVCRRLQLLSRMEHHEQDNEQVFP